RLPAQLLDRLRGVAAERIYLRRAQIARVDFHEFPVVEAGVREGDLAQLSHGVALACRDDVVIRRVALDGQPHRFHKVLRVSPVALRLEVAEEQLALEPMLDAAYRAGHLPRDERLAAARGLVVEEDAVDGVDSIRLAV